MWIWKLYEPYISQYILSYNHKKKQICSKMVVCNVFRANGSQKNVSVLRWASVQDTLQYINDKVTKQYYTIEYANFNDGLWVSICRYTNWIKSTQKEKAIHFNSIFSYHILGALPRQISININSKNIFNFF